MTDESIFTTALDIADLARRVAYLESACAGDPARRARVEHLLAAYGRAGDFLERPAGGPPEPDYAATRVFGESKDDDASVGDALALLQPSPRPGALGRIGHYDVLEVLGHGGFGIVFRAFDDVLQRVVAVKVLAPQMAATSPARKRFTREAQSSAKVRHENVVQVHAVEETPLPYLVMEFIPGLTLQQRLDGTGPLTVAEVVRIGRQIAEGLAAAHATGLIHRDVKPANVLIETGPHERVKLTDFGLARAADDASISQSGIVAGTPMYMAPEQAKGEQLDHRADLFSLGSVLYVMCSGRPPFRASSSLAVLKRVCDEDPRPIREIIPEVPEWLCRIIEKLHAKDPADRYQTAREVADLLTDCERQLQAHGGLKDGARIPAGKAEVEKAETPKPQPKRRVSVLRVVVAIGVPAALFAAVALAVYYGTRDKAPRDDERWAAVTGDQDVPGWGRAINPDGDCRIQAMGDRVRMTVPTKHDLSGWYKVYNAPRVMREVKGDFRARVRVRPFPDVGANPGSPAQPYLTGSLVLWGDESHFARVDRVLQLEPDMGGRNLRHDVVVFHTAAQPLGPVPSDLRRIEPNGPSHLELERRGAAVTARTSIDGTNWSAPFRLPPLDLPDTVRVGVAAVCVNSSEPHRVEFEGFEVTPLEPPPADTDGWVQLFNGKNTSGWKAHPDQPGEWRVDAGHLVSSRAAGYLFTDRADWQDFHLRAEVHVVQGGNSGIFFRTPFELVPAGSPNVFAPKGWYEADLFWGPVAHPGRIKDLGETAETLAEPNQWMTLEIIAQGNRLLTRVNGKVAVDVVDGRSTFTRGHIALQAFTPTTNVRFRKIEIKELPPTPHAPTWVALKPAELKAENGTTLTTQPDNSVLASGKHPDKDVYTLTFRDLPTKIQSLRLEVLPHDALPNKGPGRHPDLAFVLTTARVALEAPGNKGQTRELKLARAWADHSSGDDSVPALAVDADDNTGWGAEFGKPHFIVFELEEPVAVAEGARLRVTLEFKHEDARRQLGCFRVSASKELWKEEDAKKAAFDDWLKRVAALPAAEQVEEVRKELKTRNPDFDGTLNATVENDAVTRLLFLTGNVTDISPLRAFTRLTWLELDGPYPPARGVLSDLSPLKGLPLTGLALRRNQVTDLTPLTGMPLKLLRIEGSPVVDLTPLRELPLRELSLQHSPVRDLKGLQGLKLEVLGCTGTEVADLSPLKGMMLKRLAVHATPVTDLSPLKGMPLEYLNAHRTQVSDLSPLKGLPLTNLNVRETAVTDLSPVKDCPLVKLQCDFKVDRDAALLRAIKSLEEINDKSAAEFWKDVAAANPALAPLRAAVEAKTRVRDTVKQRFDAGLEGKIKLLDAECDLTDARIKLAEEERNPDAVAELVEELVKHRQEARGVIAERVAAGVEPQQALDAADARLAEAKVRLAKVKPAGRAPEPRAVPAAATVPVTDKVAAAYQEAWAKHHKTDVEFTASGVTFRVIPPGSFDMGLSAKQFADEEASLNAKKGGVSKQFLKQLKESSPERRVTVTRAFAIGRTEVTIGQYREFVKATGHKTVCETNGKGGFGRTANGDWKQAPEFNWSKTGIADATDEFPATNLTHEDAVAYCEWLTKKEGRVCRLPTEAEWEWACRAGTDTPAFWGRPGLSGGKFARHGSQKNDHDYQAVGKLDPNAFGLRDTCGNAAEWCSDQYAAYPAGAATDPAGPASGAGFVVRGGSARDLPWASSSVYREPGTLAGFRVVMELARK